MVKKVGVWIMGLFVVLFTSFNLYNYFNKDNSGSATGMFIQDMPLGLNFSLIAFIAQWAILLLIIVFAYMRFLKHKKQEEAKIAGFVLPPPKTKAETKLDTFYRLLQDKKSLSVGTIAKAFKVSKEKALEWGRILEEHDLVQIEYPAFNDAEIKIKGYDEKEEEKKKELENQKNMKKPEQKQEQKNQNEKDAQDKFPKQEKQENENKEDYKNVGAISDAIEKNKGSEKQKMGDKEREDENAKKQR